MLKKDKEGYYIVDSADKLKEWQYMTELTPIQKRALQAEMNPKPAKKGTNKKDDDRPITLKKDKTYW